MSPHELPVMQELAAGLGAENFRYVVSAGHSAERNALGWPDERQSWLIQLDRDADRVAEADQWIREADLALFGDRDHPRIKWRVDRGRQTMYTSERWFKPPLGMLRLLNPPHLLRAQRLGRWMGSPAFHYLPIGIHAVRDETRLRKLFAPACGGNPMLLWGYFVSPSAPLPDLRRRAGPMRVLWAGRMLALKRVDTLIQAVGALWQRGIDIRLSLVGEGAEEPRLRQLATRLTRKADDKTTGASAPWVSFHPPVPIGEVRQWMRKSDVYVLPSNGYEGWGAVVNEAMLEGCAVIATCEAGSAATLIRDGHNGLLFRAGDVAALTAALARLEADEALRQRLAGAGQRTIWSHWAPDVAAQRLIAVSAALVAGCEPPMFAEGPLQQIPT